MLLSSSGWATETAATSITPKATAAAPGASRGAMPGTPVADSGSVGGPTPPVSTARLALRAPVSTGLTVTSTRQPWPANSSWPTTQTPAPAGNANSSASLPVFAIALIRAPPGPLLTRLADSGADSSPAPALPKSSRVTGGDQTSVGGVCVLPLPVSTTAPGNAAALLVTVSSPSALAPMACAMKLTAIVQPAPTARVAGASGQSWLRL